MSAYFRQGGCTTTAKTSDPRKALRRVQGRLSHCGGSRLYFVIRKGRTVTKYRCPPNTRDFRKCRRLRQRTFDTIGWARCAAQDGTGREHDLYGDGCRLLERKWGRGLRGSRRKR